MIVLALQDVVKYYGAELILDKLSFEIDEGQRVGLVGSNGSGKTTVFKVICGLEPLEEGQIVIGKDLQVGYLEQIPEAMSDTKVIDVLREAFAELDSVRDSLTDLERKMSKLTGNSLEKAIEEYGRLQQRFEMEGGYEIDSAIDTICSGLGITDEFRNRQFSLLSGGEQTIVCLGRLLLQKPDILLLDEPSNHLDIDALEWLEQYLKDYRGTVIMISHDRYFLDNTANRIIELEEGKAQSYQGNYSAFVRQKEEALQLQLASYESQQKKIKAMEQTIKDLREWGKRADNPKFFKRAASIQKRLDKMEKVRRPMLEKDRIRLSFSTSGRSGKDVALLENTTFSFPNRPPLLRNADLLVTYGERVCVVGKNGTGKSTLLKLLLGELLPSTGRVVLGANVRFGYLPQSVFFEDESQTVIDCFRYTHPFTEGEARHILAKFLFFGWDVYKKVKDLSGGERSRLRLCQLMYEDLNFLILDEPTNHLDIEAIEVFEEALKEFSGTVLFVSHDRAFINSLAHRVVELDRGLLHSYLGNYEYFRQKKRQMEAERSAKESCRPKTERTKRTAKVVTIDIQALEDEIEAIENKISEIDVSLVASATDFEKQKRLHQVREDLCGKRDLLLEQWVLASNTEMNSPL